MGRFDKLLNKATDTTIVPGDEDTQAQNPRNALASAVNPLLDQYVNPALPEDYKLNVPTMTVADDKQFFKDLPETMAGATMGSVKQMDVVPGARFGKILNGLGQDIKGMSHSEIMNHPDMLDLLKKKADFVHPSQYDNAKQAVINKIKGG